MLVGSCPDYGFGNFDDMQELSKLALKYDIGLHSDCCLGSFVNPFIEKAGFKEPSPFDFRVKGITSISCDPHKYAYGPKGISTLLFRTKELRKTLFFAVSDWTGGFYATPSLAGSRPGNIIAGAWASLMKHGKDGYLVRAKEIL